MWRSNYAWSVKHDVGPPTRGNGEIPWSNTLCHPERKRGTSVFVYAMATAARGEE
jgi:hypothetical protein